MRVNKGSQLASRRVDPEHRPTSAAAAAVVSPFWHSTAPSLLLAAAGEVAHLLTGCLALRVTAVVLTPQGCFHLAILLMFISGFVSLRAGRLSSWSQQSFRPLFSPAVHTHTHMH